MTVADGPPGEGSDLGPVDLGDAPVADPGESPADGLRPNTPSSDAQCAGRPVQACRRDLACAWVSIGGGGACRVASGVCEGRQTKALCGQRPRKCSWRPKRRVCEAKVDAESGQADEAVGTGAGPGDSSGSGSNEAPLEQDSTAGTDGAVEDPVEFPTDTGPVTGAVAPNAPTGKPDTGGETSDYDQYVFDYGEETPSDGGESNAGGGNGVNPVEHEGTQAADGTDGTLSDSPPPDVTIADVPVSGESSPGEIPGGTAAEEPLAGVSPPATWPWNFPGAWLPWNPSPEDSVEPSSDDGPVMGPTAPNDPTDLGEETDDYDQNIFDYGEETSSGGGESSAGGVGNMNPAPEDPSDPRPDTAGEPGTGPTSPGTPSGKPRPGEEVDDYELYIFDYDEADSSEGGSSSVSGSPTPGDEGVSAGANIPGSTTGSPAGGVKEPIPDACAGLGVQSCRADPTCSWKPRLGICATKITQSTPQGEMGVNAPVVVGVGAGAVPGGGGGASAPVSTPGTSGTLNVAEGEAERPDVMPVVPTGGSLEKPVHTPDMDVSDPDPSSSSPGEQDAVDEAPSPGAPEVSCEAYGRRKCQKEASCLWMSGSRLCISAQPVSKNGGGDSQNFSMPGSPGEEGEAKHGDGDDELVLSGEDYSDAYGDYSSGDYATGAEGPASPGEASSDVSGHGDYSHGGDYDYDYDYTGAEGPASPGEAGSAVSTHGDYSHGGDYDYDYDNSGTGVSTSPDEAYGESYAEAYEDAYSDGDYSLGGDFDYATETSGQSERSSAPSALVYGLVAGVVVAAVVAALTLVCCLCRSRRQVPQSHGLPSFSGPLKRNVEEAEKAREGPGVSQPIAAGGGPGGLLSYFSRRRGNLNSVTTVQCGPESVPRGGQGARIVGRQDGVPVRVQVQLPGVRQEADSDPSFQPLSPSRSAYGAAQRTDERVSCFIKK